MNILRKLFGSKSGKQTQREKAILDDKGGFGPYDDFLDDELKKLISPIDAETIIYPALSRGALTAFKGTNLLRAYPGKLNQLRSGAGLPEEEFNRLVLPVLLNFAEYAHVLPASKGHHHRMPSGLLSHCLDVACRAVSTAQTTAFDTGVDPSRRTMRRERWYVATIIAGLLHDAGKPLTDYVIHDSTHDIIWPGSISITEWGAQNNIARFFLTWNTDRAEKHKVMNPVLVERFLPLETRDWIRSGGSDLYLAMIDAISCGDPKSLLTGIVIKADSNSVEIDLKTNNFDSVSMGGLAVNLPAMFSRAARQLVEDEAWTANKQGARIWTTTQGVFLAWKSAVDEINGYLDQTKQSGLPRGTDSLGNALVDHGVLERAPNGDIYWSVAPDLLANPGTGKSIKLKCVKVINPQILYLYDLQPPPVAVAIGDEGNAVRYDPEDGGMGINLFADAAAAAGEGSEADINSPGGAVAPMFSLDVAPQKPAAAVQDLIIQSSPSVVSPAAKPPAITIGTVSSASQIIVDAPAKENRPNKQGNSKPVVPAGITLDFAGGAPAPAGLIIGGGTRGGPTSPGDQAIEALKASLDSHQKESSKQRNQPAAQQAQGKGKNKKPHNKAPEPQAVQVKIEVATQQVSQPIKAAGQITPYTDQADPFANIDGISFVDLVEEKLPDFNTGSAAQDEWEDPFAVTPSPAPSQLTSPLKPEIIFTAMDSMSEADFACVEQALGGVAEPLFDSRELSLQQSEEVTIVDPMIGPDSGEDDSGLSDFDDDIMSLTGMPQPTYLTRAKLSVPVEVTGQNSLVMADKIHIPDEFKFSDDPSLAIEGIRDIPNSSPSGFMPPPASIEITVREASAGFDLSGLVEEKIASSEIAHSPKVEFDDFDLPTFNSGIVMGDVSKIQVQATPINSAPKTQNTAAGTQKQKIGSHPPAKPIRLPTTGIQVGTSVGPADSGVSVGVNSRPPAIVMAPADIPKTNAVKIGREVHQHSEGEKVVAPKEKMHAVLSKIHCGIQTQFSEKEGLAIQSFLARTPDLYEKLKSYIDSNRYKSTFAYIKYRTFVPFHKIGFEEADLQALSNARWIWTDFTVNELAPINFHQSTGFLLSTYLSECVCFLTDGQFNLARSFPETKLDFKTQGELAQMLIDDVTTTKEINGVSVKVIHRRFLSRKANELGVAELDLRTALIASHEVVISRETLYVKDDAKDANDE